MSTKHYCDMCGDEISRNYVSQRMHIKRRNFEAEIMLKKDATWNQGDCCRKCVMEILTQGKETK